MDAEEAMVGTTTEATVQAETIPGNHVAADGETVQAGRDETPVAKKTHRLRLMMTTTDPTCLLF